MKKKNNKNIAAMVIIAVFIIILMVISYSRFAFLVGVMKKDAIYGKEPYSPLEYVNVLYNFSLNLDELFKGYKVIQGENFGVYGEEKIRSLDFAVQTKDKMFSADHKNNFTTIFSILPVRREFLKHIKNKVVGWEKLFEDEDYVFFFKNFKKCPRDLKDACSKTENIKKTFKIEKWLKKYKN